MPERQLIVRPLGLITQPNKLGQFPDGAMSQASDLIFRAPGKIQQAYSKTTGWQSTFQRPRLLHSTANQLIAMQCSVGNNWSVVWIGHSLTSPTVTTGTLPSITQSDGYSQTGRLQAITMRGRTLINPKDRNIVAADYDNPISVAERTFRFAGLPQPSLNATKQAASANSQAVNADTIVTYAAILKREYTDGYLLQSRPSTFNRIANYDSSNPCNVSCFVAYNGSSHVQAGDVVELYRSQAMPNAILTDPDPGTTMYLVASVVLTPADLSGVTIVDTASASDVGGPLGGLGKELYTNPDFGGIALSNDPPPVAACMAAFKGRAWYGNCRMTGRVRIATHNGVGFLTTDKARLNGVGVRSCVGTWTSGSTTISGISASHMLGIVPGQRVFSISHGLGTTIISVGASSIVVSVAASSSQTGQSFSVEDVFEIDGTVFDVNTILLNGFPGGTYKVTSLRTLYNAYAETQEFNIEKQEYFPPATMTIRASRGDKYEPALPQMTDPVRTIQPTWLKNYVRYSKDQEPEAVPPSNEFWVGSGEIYAMVPTRDALWFFCSDGVFRVSGTIETIDGVPDIRVDPIDSSLILAGPRAWCVLRDRIYAYTNIGLMEISDEAIRPISMGVIGDLLPGQRWNEAEIPFLLADTRTDEIYIIGAHATLNFLYSARYGAFTTTGQFDGAQTGVQIATSLALVFGYTTTTLDELQPDLTALAPTGVVSVRMDLQPLLAGRPDVEKQFVDVTYIFETGAGGSVRPRFNGAEDAVSQSIPALSGNDTRLTAGVPRDAPALSGSIAPGLRFMNTTPMQLSGVSIRYVQITEQNGARQ